MLSILLQSKEYWDSEKEEFFYVGPKEPTEIQLEHSLVSVAKWEAKYKKSYTNTEEKTQQEALDYFAMMVVGEYEDKIKAEDFLSLSSSQIEEIGKYINDPMTATTFSDDKKKNVTNKRIKGEIVTAEIVYYWMTALNIPFECQYWHFNKLITLVRVCSIKNEEASNKGKKKKKMSTADMEARRARMEEARKAH